MGWTMLMSLVWVTSASAVRYADYSGVKMPQYGSSNYDIARDPDQVAVVAEDYQGHSPDASSSLDYRYEDERHGKSENPIIDSDDIINWNKPVRKHRELLRPPEVNDLETIDKYVPKTEIATKFKTNKRFLKHRSRLKTRNLHKDEEISSRWSVKNAHGKKYNSDINKDDFNIDEYEIGDDEREKLNANNERYRQHEITERVVRRKPRDKLFNKLHSNLETSNDDINFDRKINSERREKLDYMQEDEDRNRQRRPYRPFSDEDEDQEPRETVKQKPKAYEDYGEYYDMKRVHNIKNKLPMLLRRPTARMDTTVAASSNVIDTLWTYRRKNPTASISQESSSSPLFISSSIEISTSSTLKPVSMSGVPKEAPKELSLAEKSKLSIMKKAQRKESMHMETSKKPPVLLQVTNKLLTVVLVEPPTSAVPWMRASILIDDTPERVERAKKLMRNKLVARARNIQELTDNWDEMICDYIDVSMLDGVPQINRHYVLYIIEIFLLFVVF